MDVLARLDEARGAFNVLEHPFYKRWSAGELSAAELQRYAGEYRHAVMALARASALAAAKAGPEHAAGLSATPRRRRRTWSCGRTSPARPARAARRTARSRWMQTQACAQAWTAGEDLLEHLAVLYAIEAGQPEISKTKLEGLTEHYGYSDEGPAIGVLPGARAARRRARARRRAQLIVELLAERDDAEAQADRMLARAHARRCAVTGGCSTASKRGARDGSRTAIA